MTPNLPKTLCNGRFKVKEPLGRPGSDATAFLCLDEVLRKNVVCRLSHRTDSHLEFVKQFEFLSDRAARGFPRVFGIFIDDETERTLIAMERISGDPMNAWLARGQPPSELIKALASLLSSVSGLHDAGLAHGDLRPENVVVTNDGRFVLIDPSAERWGSSRKNGERSKTQRNDAEAAIDLVSDLGLDQSQAPTCRILSALAKPNWKLAAQIASDALESRVIYDTSLLPEKFRLGRALVEGREELFKRFSTMRWRGVNRLLDHLHTLQVNSLEHGHAELVLQTEYGLEEMPEEELRSANQNRSFLKSAYFSLLTKSDGLGWSFRLLGTEVSTFLRPWPTEYPQGFLGIIEIRLDLRNEAANRIAHVHFAEPRYAQVRFPEAQISDDSQGLIFWVEGDPPEILTVQMLEQGIELAYE